MEWIPAPLPNDVEEGIQENLISWDELANTHAQGKGSEFYRIDKWLSGETTLAPWEIKEIGPISGKTLLHLQCHIGTDTLSWSREGAIVTGLDFSSKSIKEAERFAELMGIRNSRFVISRVQDAVESLDGEKFDVLYTGKGALCWLPDIEEWATVCSKLVKQGGILYLEESTPMFNALTPMKFKKGSVFGLKYDLFNKNPISEIGQGSYADPTWPGKRRIHTWEYTYGGIINALVRNGFRIEHLNERDEIFFNPHPENLVKSRSNYWALKEDSLKFPLSFSIKATRI